MKGLAESRSKAQHLIKAGVVKVNGKIQNKCSLSVKESDSVAIITNPFPYVSRAGLKLERAARVFRIDFAGKIVLDVGASTGGFTDFALQVGASKVYAVDVGRDQLHPSLRRDSRVVNLERTDARKLTREVIPSLVDIVCIDVSFISLQLILPSVIRFLAPGGYVIALIKPQFEAGPSYLSRKGVVRDPAVHEAVMKKIYTTIDSLGLYMHGVTYSPYQGDAGNIEFLGLFRRQPTEWRPDFRRIVAEAHRVLGT